MKYLKTYNERIAISEEDLEKKNIKEHESLKINIDKFLDQILIDCQPYIEILREVFKYDDYEGWLKTCVKNKNTQSLLNMTRFLKRGLQRHVDYDKCNYQPNRRPIDMPREFHDFMNEELENKFGWKVRNGAFCYLCDELNYIGYGTKYLIFPIGDFEYCWNPEIRDLYVEIDDEIQELINLIDISNNVRDNLNHGNCPELRNCNDQNKQLEEYEKDIEHTRDIIYEILGNSLEYYQDDHIEDSTQKNEISISGDYYIINIQHIQQVFDKIFKQS
jgi:hypothetical protein